MTQGDKVKALIERAIDGGWRESKTYPYSEPIHEGINEAVGRLFFGDCGEVTALLFNHDFAKALFGNKDIQIDNLNENDESIYFWRTEGFDNAWFDGPAWIFHLQQAVISKDPITYMYDAVFGEK